MKKILLHILGALLAIVVIYFFGNEIANNWREIKDYSFTFNTKILIASAALYALCFFILASGWYLILRYLHFPVPFIETFLYFCITQPGKYVPGKVWIAVARTKFCKRHLVPHSVTFLTTGIEGVIEILAGTYISVFAILQTPALKEISLLGTILLIAIGGLLLVPKVFYFFVNLYLRLVKQPAIERDKQVSLAKLALLQVVYIAGMGMMGIAHLFFLQSFAPVEPHYFAFLISIGVFSYVASILAFFTPSGLGVRELVWSVGLGTIVAQHIALIFAFASRLWTILVEALLVAICLPILWLRRRSVPPHITIQF